MSAPAREGRSEAASARVAVTAEGHDAATRARAKALAAELALPLVQREDTGDYGAYSMVLVVRPDRLELRELGRRRGRAVCVDLLAGATQYRLASVRSHRQPLARAMGLHRGVQHVVDATAGLGRDALTLAACGCRVTAIERCGVLGALLLDGLKRAAAAHHAWARDIAERVTLTLGDAREVLREMGGDRAPQVVYLDPMYPQDDERALAKRELRLCRRLVGDDEDAPELLAAAREAAERVVCKRHPKAPPLAPRPTAQIAGKLARFDIYQSARRARA